MIIWGWGKVTRKIIGGVTEMNCNYCNQSSIWNLCLVRTWFTLFFIPIIPYKFSYQIACPHCGSYISISKEQYTNMKRTLENKTVSSEIPDDVKYHGKTETQINFLKHMEECEKNEIK